ncbi:hypothetical protein Vadar_012257 [Vaccinium darrowii]|uniref:Uncharacterized protein n=1 Tax=Vaccinium darrowii TaxID=229202 RepID=A0ACB7XYJ9_9ERIC|nr:hypothetical protein Vadar_012257 [Vaccinium darrowii]
MIFRWRNVRTEEERISSSHAIWFSRVLSWRIIKCILRTIAPVEANSHLFETPLPGAQRYECGCSVAQRVRRAERAGFKAIAITVDTLRLGRRDADLKSSCDERVTFDFPPSSAAREKAMVVNLEFIKAIVIAEEVLLLDPLRHEVLPFVDQLRQQLPDRSRVKRYPMEFEKQSDWLTCTCTKVYKMNKRREAYCKGLFFYCVVP